MGIPAIRGIIDRRILVNYRIEPEAMARILPAPFRPKTIAGFAIGGICLIRLKRIRPAFLPIPFGFGSENGAHRFAVEWDDGNGTREGVYIPRRDTDSRLVHLLGGRIFPGVHHHARFECRESDKDYFVELQNSDSETRVHVQGRVTTSWPAKSVFESLSDASAFFEEGSLGYSATRTDGTYEGLELACDAWQCEALNVNDVYSSYFEDKSKFPDGSVQFDCALLMRGIDHEWHSRRPICCDRG